MKKFNSFIEKVAYVQSTLKAPKSQFNKFGNYAYRNAEDILEAVKPILAETGLVLTITDEVIFNPAGGESYIKAVATITDGEKNISNSALAREASDQKGMSSAQITGSTSSYARKYALNGLFLIDDTKDADATNTHGKDDVKEIKSKYSSAVKKAEAAASVQNAVTALTESTNSKNEAPTTVAASAKPKGFTAFKKKPTESLETKSANGDMY